MGIRSGNQEVEMATNRWLYVALVDVDADKVGAKVAKMLGKDWDPCGGLCALPAGLARTVFRVPAPGDTKGLGKIMWRSK